MRRRKTQQPSTFKETLKASHINGRYAILAAIIAGIFALIVAQPCKPTNKNAGNTGLDSSNFSAHNLREKKDSVPEHLNPKTSVITKKENFESYSQKRNSSLNKENKISEINGPVHNGNVTVEKGAVYVNKNEGNITVTNQNNYCEPKITITDSNLNQEVESILNEGVGPKFIPLPEGVQKVFRSEVSLKYQCDGRSGASLRINWPLSDLVHKELDCRKTRGCLITGGIVPGTKDFVVSLVDVKENIYTIVVYTKSKIDISNLSYEGK